VRVTVRCWGSNDVGQIGDGTTQPVRLTPTVVTGLGDATQIEAGSTHTCVRRQNGTVSCWGSGSEGQLGDGTGDTKLSPIVVPGLTGVQSVRARNSDHTCAEMNNRTVKCWGSNLAGEIGDGTNIPRPTPVDVKLR
jgi:alpha-tubulin suppressor-like RCC1 family protein